MTPSYETGAAIALVGAAVFEIHKMYVNHAGPLSDARASSGDDTGMRAKLADADILTGTTALTVGATVSVVTGKGAPLLLAVLGFLIVSCYYHATLLGQRINADDGS